VPVDMVRTRAETIERFRTAIGHFSEEEIDRTRNYVRRASSPGSLDAQIMMLADFDLRQVLPAIRVPTLLFHGTENPILPVGGSRYLADGFLAPGSSSSRARCTCRPVRRWIGCWTRWKSF